MCNKSGNSAYDARRRLEESPTFRKKFNLKFIKIHISNKNE